MEIWEILALATSLAMDAFSVSICKGVTCKKSFLKTGFVCGLWFGIFQGLMPLLGWLLGSSVWKYIEPVQKPISFILLSFLGVKMIVEAVKEWKEDRVCDCVSRETKPNKEDACDDSLKPFTMLTMAVATSIDALAVGFTLVGSDIILAVSAIALITFAFCFVGSIVGAKIGAKFKTPAEIAGGVVLIILAFIL